MVLAYALLFITWLDWKTLKTEQFTVIHKPGYQWEALQTLENLEYYRQRIVDLTGSDTRNVPVVVENVGTMSNGFADPFLYNIHIFTYPPGLGHSLEGIESWYRSVSVHEYTHIAHLTKTKGLSRILTSIFGAPFQSNMYSPGWLIEGMAVFGESQFSSYEGRLNDGYTDSYVRARVIDKKFPSITEATNTPLLFPLDGIYLYGGEFFDFLSDQYGVEKFRSFFDKYGSYFWSPLSAFIPFFGVDLAARKVYGKSFPRLFKEWQYYSEKKYQDQYDADRPLTEKGWFISSLAVNDEKIYFACSKPMKLGAFHSRWRIEIVELEPATGNEKILARLTTSVTTPLRVSKNKLYYTTRELKKGKANVYLRGFGVTSTMWRKDLITGENRMLFTDDIRAFCILPDNNILYSRDRPHKFGSELWIYGSTLQDKIWETDYMIFEMVANSDWIIVAAGKEYENPDLYIFNLEDNTFTPLLSTPWREGYLSLNEEDILLFTANFNGKHSFYEMDLETAIIWQLASNSFAQSGIKCSNQLYYVGLNSSGYDIYVTECIREEYKLPDWPLAAKPDLHIDENRVVHGGYLDVLKTLFPVVRAPFILPADERFTKWLVGGLLLGGDVTLENTYYAYLAYDAQVDSLIANVSWNSWFLSPLYFNLSFEYNNALYYGLNYPIYAKLGPGLSAITFYFNGSSFDYFTRKEFTPGLSFNFSYPRTTLFANAWFPFERRAWGSSIDRGAQFLTVGVNQVMFGGEFRLQTVGASDAHNPDTMSLPLRGYDPDSVLATQGIITSLEYSHRLLSLRTGLWDPSVYLEDLFGSVFIDHGIDQNGETYYSAGCELSLEAKVAFGYLQFIPRVGFAVNENRDISVYFELVPATHNPYFGKDILTHF